MRNQSSGVLCDTQYDSEADLVQNFLSLLQDGGSPWGDVETTTEWDYRNGITDVLVRTPGRSLVAFEAKLTDWRRAAHQAYRNTTFAKQVYVVMPVKAAAKACAHAEIFERYGIGLCAVQKNGVSIIIEAPEADDEPLLPWMHRRAHSFFDEVAEYGLPIAERSRRESMRTN
jgi:hypothetical protein